MSTIALTASALIASLIGVVFYGMSGASGGIVILSAMALGLAVDTFVRLSASRDEAA
ncbi:MAG: hypothetical protein IT538_00740 [Variibacter sp.]|nr:hypothetical protein [Variibacter sp.]